MRWLAYIGILAFLLFFAVGYSYFYPASSPLGRDQWFAENVVSVLDGWFVSGRTGAYSGHLIESRGELKYKSDSDFVFYPARGMQRFYGKTMISSGASAMANIEVAEGVRVQMEANSVLVIEPAIAGQDDGPTIRVIGGAVVAKADKSAAKSHKVKVVATNGKSRVVDQKGVAVVADGKKGYIGELPSDIKELRDSFASENEQIAEQERVMQVEAAKAEAARQVELAKQREVEKQQEIAKRMKDFSIQSTETDSRSPASQSETAVTIEVPQKIEHRKFDASLVAAVKDAPDTSVAKGLYQAKRGEKAEATRSFASALSSPLYGAGEIFSPSVQVAFDGMLESYVMSGRCTLAKDTVSNVLKQYKSDASAQKWGRVWQNKLTAKNNQNCR